MAKTVSKSFKTSILIIIWLGVLTPYIGLFGLLNMVNDSSLPGFEELENPESNLASVMYTSDLVELGKYYQENRTNANFNDLSEWLVQALIATEDERFYNHSGIDVRSLGRVAKGVITGSTNQGGGSTISQQLSKLLFPREKLNKWGLVKRKFKEWIIASRLEKNYTKHEIIAMYFNKFDFLNNAVGINSAANVYFNKSPSELNLEESAMLIGMAKNPSLYNPLRFPERVLKRREVVLFQMKKNGYIDSLIYDSVKALPLGITYTRVDHQTGLAPYFRETLRGELVKLFKQKNENGEYKISKFDGSYYDIYSDGLKIYTTIDSRIQQHAEYAVAEHLKFELQDDFFKNNSKWKNPPFSNDLKKFQIDTILNRAMRQSQMYKKYSGVVCRYCERSKRYLTKTDEHEYLCSYCKTKTPIRTKKEIIEILKEKRKIKVFDWKSSNYEKDTLMSAMDSIRYYKGILRASLVSIDPNNGQVMAWVGGPYFKHFKYDMVKKGRRQVGSTFKPFVYATAIEVGVIDPCDEIPDIEHCVEVPYNKYRNELWCPSNAGAEHTGAMMSIPFALAASMNNITASIIKKESMPKKVFDRIEQLGINTSNLIPVPSMALGVFELTVFEMVGAMTSFVNNGIFIEPTYIIRIEDKYGNVIFNPELKARQVWNQSTSNIMLDILKLVTSGIRHPTLKKLGGTAIRIRGKPTKKRPYTGIKQPVAGKTGTTQNQSDGWFMGLTPDLVTGVWVGAEDRSVRFQSIKLGMGTNMALPIWAYFTHKINQDSTLDISQGDFEKPFGEEYIDPLNCLENKPYQQGNENFNLEDGLNIWGQEDDDW